MNQFSIKDIESLTGVKAHTLRTWELRYNIPQPKRTATNIRYYDDNDLKLVLNFALLNKHGFRISEITKLSEQKRNELISKYSMKSTDQSVHIQSMIAAMLALDEHGFEKVLASNILSYGLEKTITKLLFPFLKTVGQLWQAGNINPAYEHFMSNLIRQKLIVAIDGQYVHAHDKQKKFLLFLPPGEYHEIGLLVANYMIRANNHITLYLGANLPVDEILKMGDVYQPDFIFTSFVTGATEEQVKTLVKKISKQFPAQKILVTGEAFLRHSFTLPKNVFRISELEDLKKFL